MKLLILCFLVFFSSACSYLPTYSAQQTTDSAANATHDDETSPDSSSFDSDSSISEALANSDLLTEVEVEELAEPEPETDLWARVSRQFTLDHSLDHPSVHSAYNWYMSNPRHVKTVSERAKRYLFHFVEEAEKRGMPGEIALLPFVESSLDPYAMSHGGASGLWQFIESTGAAYGLEQDWWVDERRHVTQSTDAALTYLAKLNKQFDGDWLLALASYNSGAGTVRRAMRNNKRAGKPTDYWSLRLPKETRFYVPKLLALANLIESRDQHELDFVAIDNSPYFAQVSTQGQIELAQIAKAAGTPIEEIGLLNPQYRRWATHPDGPHQVLVPLEKVESVNSAIANMPKSEKVRWDAYTIRSGDNLSKIGQKFHTSARLIREVNQLNSNMIHPGQVLLVPGPSFKPDQLSSIRARQAFSSSKKSKLNYRVKPGDSLWSIAHRYKVAINDIARWNSLNRKKPLQIGQRLVIWRNKRA